MSAPRCRCSRALDGERGGVPRAYLHATQQAFLEAHEHAFAYSGGVFTMLRYDNLASTVRNILRGHRLEETVPFLAFRSHWLLPRNPARPARGMRRAALR
jgi:hypothetical protein